MNQQAAALEFELSRVKPRVAYYLALTKPRVLTMILVATLTGFYLGCDGHLELRLALDLVIGTALAAGGTLAFNQYLERDLDALMDRTRTRPLPAGNLHPMQALWFGTALMAVGFAYLYFTVNGAATLVTAVITATYLAIYTPLKQVSSLSSLVGAIPGALPPVAGWAAVRGRVDAPAWILFGIMYVWQLPHTLAIAQLYRDDYNRAGVHLLGTGDPAGHSTARQTVIYTVALMGVAMLPALFGFAGMTYLIVASALGVVLLGCGIQFALKPDAAGARLVMLASLVYLPALMLLMVLDKI